MTTPFPIDIKQGRSDVPKVSEARRDALINEAVTTWTAMGLSRADHVRATLNEQKIKWERHVQSVEC